MHRFVLRAGGLRERFYGIFVHYCVFAELKLALFAFMDAQFEWEHPICGLGEIFPQDCVFYLLEGDFVCDSKIKFSF